MEQIAAYPFEAFTANRYPGTSSGQAPERVWHAVAGCFRKPLLNLIQIDKPRRAAIACWRKDVDEPLKVRLAGLLQSGFTLPVSVFCRRLRYDQLARVFA